MAALLSYLVPGLGQIYQGRIGKGILFFVCLYGMFFYGMYLGHWSNVYLVDEKKLEPIPFPWVGPLPGTLSAIGHRPQFAGQFWIGMAAWPALWQYATFDQPAPVLGNYQRMPSEDFLNELQRNGDKSWDLAWVYTVIAGVLNILVIYDAFAGPAFLAAAEAVHAPPEVRAA